jgi:methylmalonyl-CoA mutase cobalamin-binding domain/chain
MTNMAEALHILEDFPPVPTETWKAVIHVDLKGEDYNKKLVWNSDEGIVVRPYYRSEDIKDLESQIALNSATFPFARGRGSQSWKQVESQSEVAADAIRVDAIHEQGGKSIEIGLPKQRIEEASARRQAKIDSGEEVIVGVNKYRLEVEDTLDTLEVDNRAVRGSQIRRLNEVKSSRNQTLVNEALQALTETAETGKGNLLECSVNAARVRATLGEISMAMGKVFGRYKAVSHTISGVYAHESEGDPAFQKAQDMANEFANREGRRPRILVAKAGQDGHDRGAKVIASAFADIGFDVDVGPLFATTAEVARNAVENDVHVVGISTLAAGHKTLVPELVLELKKQGRGDIRVIVGGVIPQKDYENLYRAGASAVFGPGTNIPQCAQKVLDILTGKEPADGSHSDRNGNHEKEPAPSCSVHDASDRPSAK